MIRYLSLTLLIIFDDTLTRKILIFYELYACYSIRNADTSLSNSPSNAIRGDVVVILGFRLGNSTAVVLQQHADVLGKGQFNIPLTTPLKKPRAKSLTSAIEDHLSGESG